MWVLWMSKHLVSIATTFQQRFKGDRLEDDCAWGETWKLYRRNVWWKVATKRGNTWRLWGQHRQQWTQFMNIGEMEIFLLINKHYQNTCGFKHFLQQSLPILSHHNTLKNHRYVWSTQIGATWTILFSFRLLGEWLSASDLKAPNLKYSFSHLTITK